MVPSRSWLLWCSPSAPPGDCLPGRDSSWLAWAGLVAATRTLGARYSLLACSLPCVPARILTLIQEHPYLLIRQVIQHVRLCVHVQLHDDGILKLTHILANKPSGLHAARKLRTSRRENRWADKNYKKRALGKFYKTSPTGGSSHAKGIVLEKVSQEFLGVGDGCRQGVSGLQYGVLRILGYRKEVVWT